ncbi:TPA: CoA transferase subunit A [Candidatus Galligastranaerophilus faecipullorum]|nr:CoA transferase subunit A [Candidatus Galligastranaerophilus faecipullorum]
MKKIVSAKDAISLIKDGASIMVGGFLSCGAPDKLIDELVRQGKKNLTMICNDTSYPDVDKGKVITNRLAKKVVAAHIGTNPETGRQMQSGETEVELVPMGTLVEKIRAKGAGLGGVLTQTGIGTILEDNKEIIEVEGKRFIFEKPLGADFALIYGTKVDRYGNVAFFGTTRNFNTVMATAADTVIVQADEIVDCIDPNDVVIPGLFVDYIVKREEE